MEGLEELGLGRGGGGPGQGAVAGPGLGLGPGALAGPGLGLGPGPAAGPAMGPGLVSGLGPGPGVVKGPGVPSSAVAGLPTRLRQWKTSERCFPVPFREVQGGFDYKVGGEYPFPLGSPPQEAISEGDWRVWVRGANERLKATRGRSLQMLVGGIFGVPFFLQARKARSRRRALLWETLTDEFNDRCGRKGRGGFQMVYAKTMTPRLNVVLLE